METRGARGGMVTGLLSAVCLTCHCSISLQLPTQSPTPAPTTVPTTVPTKVPSGRSSGHNRNHISCQTTRFILTGPVYLKLPILWDSGTNRTPHYDAYPHTLPSANKDSHSKPQWTTHHYPLLPTNQTPYQGSLTGQRSLLVVIV